jgi:hypothetical protein
MRRTSVALDDLARVGIGALRIEGVLALRLAGSATSSSRAQPGARHGMAAFCMMVGVPLCSAKIAPVFQVAGVQKLREAGLSAVTDMRCNPVRPCGWLREAGGTRGSAARDGL